MPLLPVGALPARRLHFYSRGQDQLSAGEMQFCGIAPNRRSAVFHFSVSTSPIRPSHPGHCCGSATFCPSAGANMFDMHGWRDPSTPLFMDFSLRRALAATARRSRAARRGEGS